MATRRTAGTVAASGPTVTTETIFNDSIGLEAYDDNGSPNFKNNDDGGSITTATVFTPLLADVYAIGVRWWAPLGGSWFSPIAGLFEMDTEFAGFERKRATFGALATGSWNNTCLFDTPYPLTVGTYYGAAVYSPRYVATLNYGPLTVPGGHTSPSGLARAIQNNSPYANGRYAFGPSDLAYPSSNYSSSFYYVDVIVRRTVG